MSAIKVLGGYPADEEACYLRRLTVEAQQAASYAVVVDHRLEGLEEGGLGRRYFDENESGNGNANDFYEPYMCYELMLSLADFPGLTRNAGK